ncbi:MAG: SGNH/GDSL hydrolase family protein [Nitrospiraceae bacterium]
MNHSQSTSIMNGGTSPREHPKTDLVLVAALYLWQLSALLVVITLYRLATKGGVGSFLTSLPGVACLAALLILCVSITVIFHRLRYSLRAGSRLTLLTLIMNLVVVVLLCLACELTIRFLSVQTTMGAVIGDTLLPPREWRDVAVHYSGILRKAASRDTFLVYDDMLGWSPGSNRRSENGRFFSSVEGLRSPRPGVRYNDHPSACRVAVFGDSFTFDEEVSFEDSWPHQLELLLPPGCQVLNFGVPGYSVSQAYLRYLRDARSWRPNVVILSPIGHNLLRSMGVYGFLTLPGGMVPHAMPRFVVANDELVPLNLPLPPPEQILSIPSVRDLPYIEYDRMYSETEWDRRYWRLFHVSYLFRYLISQYPLWEAQRPQTSDEQRHIIHREIFRSFNELATARGSVPLIVYLPVDFDLSSWAETTGYVPEAIRIARDAGIDPIDLTPCVRKVNSVDRFAPGNHYQPPASRAVADCLSKPVIAHLQSQDSRTDTLGAVSEKGRARRQGGKERIVSNGVGETMRFQR